MPGHLANHPMKRYSPGTPREKRVFATVRYTDAILTQELNNERAARGLGDGDLLAAVGVAKALFNVQRRVIGRAQSTSKPGQPFDIMLAHYCA